MWFEENFKKFCKRDDHSPFRKINKIGSVTCMTCQTWAGVTGDMRSVIVPLSSSNQDSLRNEPVVGTQIHTVNFESLLQNLV